MKKQIILAEQAKEQLLEGAKILYDAVSSTLGPKGSNVVIQAYGEPIVTHDGVTVAKAIENVDGGSPGAQVGIEMIKASSSKTNDNVGDGTTSSTILAYNLIEKGLKLVKANKNPMILRRELDAASFKALDALSKLSIPVKTEKQLIEIATISSENEMIGHEVGKMYHALGKDAMVVVEIGSKPKIEYEIVKGYSFDRGFLSAMQVTDSKTQTTTLYNPAILVTHSTVSASDVAGLVGEAYQEGHDSIVIVCNDFKPSLLEHALRSANEDIFIVGVKAPGFGDNRIELLKDLAAITGTTAVGDKLPKKIEDLTVSDLGSCEEIVITANETVITGGKNITDYIAGLAVQAEQVKGEFEKSKITKRIAQLNSKVGHIRVGGNTEMEAEDRKYLVDDAVAATEAAQEDGIVPGGGTTYIEVARALDGDSDGEKLLKESLEGPFRVLMTNAGLRAGVQIEKLTEFGKGFDVMGDPDVLVDMKEHGIIDPVMVIKQAIINATSVAGSVLSTGVLIANKKETKDEEKDEDF